VNGIIDGLPLSDYLKDPAPVPSLSASLAHILLTRSPLHCFTCHPRLNPDWSPGDSEPRQIIGTVAHALLLENDRGRVVVVDEKDWRKKDAQAQRDEALATGRLPILSEDMEHVEAMVAAAREQIAASERPDLFVSGHVERSMVWEEGGVWWRSRPDWISTDGLVLADVKTTGGAGEPLAWSNGPLTSYEFDLQGALALRGARYFHGHAERAFVFVVIETAPPFALSLVGLGPTFLEFAERKLNRAAELWRACRETGVWPGYPARICWADPPPYALARHEDRRLISALPADGSVDDL